MLPNCPLCKSPSTYLHTHLVRDYFTCSRCRSAFADPNNHLSYADEESRYLEHNNDVFDVGYRKFVKPVTDTVLNNFLPYHHGLDFGAGPGPIISQVLKESGYSIEQFDPFFCNRPEVLTRQYDYIACCEVIEHFHNPYKEFVQLKSMLKPGGMLICMTDIFYDDIDFAKWYYKNDPTHVFFYHPISIEFIEAELGFAKSNLCKRLIWFKR
ncbi:MAG: methyltransferase domain-containing protein [Tenuifilaceae bacterium]|jgi:SAM-dependent methyltransferase|nr:methyltransferase domain-containing protein [Tenuifilaceae bacterium]